MWTKCFKKINGLTDMPANRSAFKFLKSNFLGKRLRQVKDRLTYLLTLFPVSNESEYLK